VNSRQRRRIRPFDDLGLRVQKRRHPMPGHARGRQRAVQPHQRLNRRDDPRLVGHERGQRAERERALDDAPAAVDEDRGGPEPQQHGWETAAEIVDPLQAHERSDEPVVEP
jgi:hypothetical protein